MKIKEYSGEAPPPAMPVGYQLPPIEYLEKLFALGTKHNAAEIRMPGIWIALREAETPQLVATGGKMQRAPLGEKHGMPTEDELLFASSPLGAPASEAEAPE